MLPNPPKDSGLCDPLASPICTQTYLSLTCCCILVGSTPSETLQDRNASMYLRCMGGELAVIPIPQC